MLRLLPSEKFLEIEVPSYLRRRYAVSNHGRMISFTDSMSQGRLLANSDNGGYVMFRYQNLNREKGMTRYTMLFVYRLVAELFVERPSEEHKHVIHLDHSRNNDHYKNLKWVTPAEKMEHYKKSPNVLEGQRRFIAQKHTRDGHKLTITDVIRLKKMISNPNRKTRLKILAKQFGISEMQLYRIKSGENWSHISI